MNKYVLSFLIISAFQLCSEEIVFSCRATSTCSFSIDNKNYKECYGVTNSVEILTINKDKKVLSFGDEEVYGERAIKFQPYVVQNNEWLVFEKNSKEKETSQFLKFSQFTGELSLSYGDSKPWEKNKIRATYDFMCKKYNSLLD
tara:strand:- start:634 stop:1065 length:432 start_codon:yes stop_codon:yes gene_type:complete